MFGLMELTEQLNDPVKIAIIPTVVIPFTILGMILTSLATWLAAFFGIQLKAEGPKKLFEVLMKPKILILALISNLIFYGIYQGGIHLKNSSLPLWLIELKNNQTHSTFIDQIKVNKKSSEVGFQIHDNTTHARSLKNIEVIWQKKLNSAVFGGISASGSSLFMGTRDGTLIELNALTGEQIKEIWTGQPIMTKPIIIDEKIYFGEGVHDTHHARYYNFDINSGRLNSAFTSTGHIERKATLAQIENKQILLIPAGRDGVYAVDPITMTQLWQSKTGHVDASPVADTDNAYFGTAIEKGYDETETHVIAVELKTGNTLWKKSIPTSSWGIPLLWKELVCFSIGDVYKNTHYGQFSCYNRKTGDENLSINVAGALISEPTLINDQVIVSDIHGVIYQLNLNEKKIDWKINVPSKGLNYASVFLDEEDRIFLAGDDGVSIFSRTTQNLIYQWKPVDSQNKPWKKPYSNLLVYQDLWIVADGNGDIWGLKAIY